MIKKTVSDPLKSSVFDFFFWFSRFEFALKEHRYWKSKKPGKPAEADWQRFISTQKAKKYSLSPIAEQFIQLYPKKQVINKMRTGLEWRPLSFSENVSDLEKIVKTLKTVRNNLFHGGKQDLAGWEDDHRTAELVTLGRQVLDELAEKAQLKAYKPA